MLPSLFWVLSLSSLVVHGLPEQGKWTLHVNSSNEYNGVAKNVYGDTKIYVRIACDSSNGQEVKVGWLLRETQCWNEYAFLDGQRDIFPTYYNNPDVHLEIPGMNLTKSSYVKYNEVSEKCDGSIVLQSKIKELTTNRNDNDSSDDQHGASGPTTNRAQYNIPHSGDYLFVIHMQGEANGPFSATVEVEIKGPHGYLSMVDWPLLPFFGSMCGVYVLMGLAWLVLCGMHWRDLLRIQFWIGGVIFLGMLEKAMFLAEYQNINSSGVSTKGLILAAEVVSCAKRTLARMLVIIVSLGFGIVKPRLGPTLHRVVGIGALYFTSAAVEAYLRVMTPKNDVSGTTMLAGIPLAVIDSSICWWVFSALVQTTRTLRLRRNIVKLDLYRHFTNTLILAVIASVVFMLWSIKYHRMEECLKDWRDLWVDEAFWHLLFSLILCVIMFLWRPSQNNQRYAFTPLLDNEEDEDTDDDDDDDPFYHGKVTQRSVGPPKSPREPAKDPSEEDPMKWIEENIPESAENPLPVLDSDEEIETTKFEISKMQ